MKILGWDFYFNATPRTLPNSFVQWAEGLNLADNHGQFADTWSQVISAPDMGSWLKECKCPKNRTYVWVRSVIALAFFKQRTKDLREEFHSTTGGVIPEIIGTTAFHITHRYNIAFQISNQNSPMSKSQ